MKSSFTPRVSYRARADIQIGPARREALEIQAREIFERLVDERRGDLDSPAADEAWDVVLTELNRLRDEDSRPGGAGFDTFDQLDAYLEGFIRSTVNEHFGTPAPEPVNPAERGRSAPRARLDPGAAGGIVIDRQALQAFARQSFARAKSDRGLEGADIDFGPVRREVERVVVERIGSNGQRVTSQAAAEGVIRLFINQYLDGDVELPIDEGALQRFAELHFRRTARNFGLSPDGLDFEPVQAEVVRVLDEGTDMFGRPVTTQREAETALQTFINDYLSQF